MNPDLALALELADIADAVSMRRFRATDLRVDTKGDGTPVTDADRQVEERLRETLRLHRPGHGVCGEEYGVDGSVDWRWYVDPIDGTRNYERGVPVWATLIALRHKDVSVCGVVSAPALRRRWWAARGEGAGATGSAPLRVSRVADLSDAFVSCTDPRDFDAPSRADGFRHLVTTCRTVRAFGDFWSHVLVAEGALDVGIEAAVNAWDVAPLQVIVEEAGGRMTDFEGRPRIDSGTVITSNGLLHDAVVDLFRSS